MNKKSVLAGRARFDNEDAKGVVIFLQEGEDAAPLHRGWRREQLADLISKKKPIKMALTEELNVHPNKPASMADMLAYAEKIKRLSDETGIEAQLFMSGYTLYGQMAWERKATEMEEIAAKAYIRDHADQPKAIKKYGARIYAEAPAPVDPFAQPVWDAPVPNEIRAGGVRIQQIDGDWIAVDEEVPNNIGVQIQNG